jgi:O-antigen/teichoic acid export membrane protein
MPNIISRARHDRLSCALPHTGQGMEGTTQHAARDRAKGLGRDALHFGSASAFAAALGVLQVLLVPKLLTVTTYGLYRIFVLYAGYAGVLHFGGVDGALLRWAGRSWEHVAPEWRIAMRWLIRAQTVIVLVAVVAALVVRRWSEESAVIVLALGLYAFVYGASGLSAFALQATRRFRSAGVAVYGPNALFLLALVFLPPAARTLGAVLALYVGAQAGTALLLRARVRARTPREPAVRDETLSPARLVAAGAPLMAANTVGGLAQGIDRFLVSWALPVHEFALYGFGASAFFAANALATSLARVALPHAAARPASERAELLGRFSDVIVCAVAAGLGAYPLFEWVVAVWLPAYVDALPIARALLPGALFWLGTLVVTNTGLQVARRVPIQLALAVGTVLAIAVLSGAAIAMHAPLWTVALAASTGAGLQWVAGVIALRRVAPGQGLQRPGEFAFIGLTLCACAVLVVAAGWNAILSTVVYLVAAGVLVQRALHRLRSSP